MKERDKIMSIHVECYRAPNGNPPLRCCDDCDDDVPPCSLLSATLLSSAPDMHVHASVLSYRLPDCLLICLSVCLPAFPITHPG